MKYGWKNGSIHNADPQNVGEELESLGEIANYSAVVEKARDENSAMHNEFEWDDAVAGEKYRITQAMAIVRHIIVVNSDESKKSDDAEPITVRAFVSTGERNGNFTQMAIVVKDRDRYEQQLAEAYKELQAFKRKYAHLRELEEILSLIED